MNIRPKLRGIEAKITKKTTYSRIREILENVLCVQLCAYHQVLISKTHFSHPVLSTPELKKRYLYEH